MFPLVPIKVPSPLADREFCARRRSSMFLWPTATSLPTMVGALLALPCSSANLGGPAARAELFRSQAGVGTSHGNGGEAYLSKDGDMPPSAYDWYRL